MWPTISFFEEKCFFKDKLFFCPLNLEFDFGPSNFKSSISIYIIKKIIIIKKKRVKISTLSLGEFGYSPQNMGLL